MQTAQRVLAVQRLVGREQPPGRARHDAGHVRGAAQRGLARVAGQVARAAHADGHRGRAEARLAQPLCHGLGQEVDERLRVGRAHDVVRRGQAVAEALHRAVHLVSGLVVGLHRRRILAPRERAQHKPDLAQAAAQQLGRGARQLADAVDPRRVQLGARGGADVQELAHRSFPHPASVVLRRDERDGVGFAEVAAELREYLVPRHADGHRAAQLGLDAAADLGGRARRVTAQKRQRAGEVEPRLIEAERLHEVGVLVVDAPRHGRVRLVHLVAWRHHHEPRALRARLPQRLARLDARRFRLRALRQHDAVAQLLVPAHHERHAPQLRPLGLLDARVERVHVGMEDHPALAGAFGRADHAAAERLGNPHLSCRRHSSSPPSAPCLDLFGERMFAH